jgi:hypothetical protein
MSLGGASGYIQPGINAALENKSNAPDYQTGGYSPYENYAPAPYLPYAQQGPYQAIMSQMGNYGGGLGSGYQQGISSGLFGGGGAMGGFNPDLYKRAEVAAAAPIVSDMQYRGNEFLGGGGNGGGDGRSGGGGSASSGGGEGPGGMGRGGGMGGGGMGGDTGSGAGSWAKGGSVMASMLQGPNPMGPDQGYGALKSGEFVINDKAVAKYGIDLMNAINSGKISKGKLRGLLEM